MSFLINLFIYIGMFFEGIGLIRNSYLVDSRWDFALGVLLIVVSLIGPPAELIYLAKQTNRDSHLKK